MIPRFTMTRRALSRTRIAAALFAVAAPLAAADPSPAGPSPEAAAGIMAARLEPAVRAVFETGLAPGFAVAVVKDGAVVYAQGFGYADVEAKRPVGPDTRFYIASVTKSLTALAAARLAREGKIDLDAPVTKYLPAIRLADSLSPDRITLRDLLAHTHGIANDGPVTFRSAFSGEPTDRRLLQYLARHRPAPTGRNFKYGNLGYVVAGFALESATGSEWKEVVEAEVLRPIGMTRTTALMSRASDDLAAPYRMSPDGFERLHRMKRDATMHAAGGHVSTARDLARYLIAHLGEGRIDGKQVVPEAAIAETHRLQAPQQAKMLDYARHGWGLGWDLGTYDADTLVSRSGNFDGSFCQISFMPARGIGVVALANEAQAGGMLAMMATNAVYDRMLEKPGVEEKWGRIVSEATARAADGRKRLAEDAKRRAARPQATAHPLEAYAGEYEHPDFGRMRWRKEGARLHASLGALESDAEVFDGAKDQFRVELTGGGEVISFEFDGGRAKALLYDEARFERR